MLGTALMFLIVAIISDVLGLSGIAGSATQLMWIIFVVCLGASLVFMLLGRRPRS